ncbi:putative F-box/kelch-repeat protein At3g17280 [Lolium rigidum]|uniref:putative F-box/kelch-repeat protein At3g17280 n=1 Tax=Lolium rigidum TaxID=89674 RepID=UPI001F5DFEF2|nr:putative F-box/kelch-repeat protein At3g17280 [Lolium rigidum]
MVSEEVNSKKQRNEECFINCLPRDLIERVFLRLPVSTLLMCVGVCKPWQNLIRDPQFVTLHLKHASHFALLFFGKESIAGERHPSDAILIDEAWSQSTYAVPVVRPDDILFGSCNGLLGLYTKTSSIKIANLATGECLHLEKPVKNLKGDHFSSYSFGFHPLTKEYKITHFLRDCVEDHPENNDRFKFIQVYKLGDETWKDIRTPEDLSLNCVRNSGSINVAGTMYWLTEDMAANWHHAVMSFDLGKESFARIQLPASVPEDCASGGPRRYWIREINGKISIATAQTHPSQPTRLVGELQIWTLDNKAEQRWSQNYNILATDYIPGPSLAHGEKLLTQCRDGNLYSYELLAENVTSKVLKMAKLLDFSPRKPDNMQSYICVKSLVRLDVYKKAGIVCRPNQREGLESKKWEAWQQMLSKMEELWSCIHQKENRSIASSQQLRIRLNALLPHLSDDSIRQQIGMEIGQKFPVFPDQKARSLRRLNFVEQKRDREALDARINKYLEIIKGTTEALDNISSMINSAIQVQVGASISNVVICSQNHSEGEDAVDI